MVFLARSLQYVRVLNVISLFFKCLFPCQKETFPLVSLLLKRGEGGETKNSFILQKENKKRKVMFSQCLQRQTGLVAVFALVYRSGKAAENWPKQQIMMLGFSQGLIHAVRHCGVELCS